MQSEISEEIDEETVDMPEEPAPIEVEPEQPVSFVISLTFFIMSSHFSSGANNANSFTYAIIERNGCSS